MIRTINVINAGNTWWEMIANHSQELGGKPKVSHRKSRVVEMHEMIFYPSFYFFVIRVTKGY
jgi:hypothetical protein